jgi:hypothetical protein
MNNEILIKAINLTEKMVDFRCTKYPQKLSCEKCSEQDECQCKEITWNCDNTLKYFECALAKLGVVNTLPYIEYVKERGGYCDCEIIFNVKDDGDYKKRFIEIKQLTRNKNTK